eukprot:TRINITY_DN120_c0_g2_i2.p1 TRINITY_DN120_c0_g2~~TRINITY_DN120_c0_g2_i2.p1  ORF type:complete len:387 (+),score=101.51 TRINITY_DN120_c0_g2_i2:107-1267(+)
MAEAERGPAGCFAAACGLQLYLRIDRQEGCVPVDLSADATISDLKGAVRDAGGPPVPDQALSVGPKRLVGPGHTPLSDTGLVVSEAVVSVARRRPRHHHTMSCSTSQGIAILEDGSVLAWGVSTHHRPMPDFRGAHVSCVQCGFGFCAAIADGRLVVWGGSSGDVRRDAAAAVGDREVVCISADEDTLAVVDADGHLHTCGKRARIPVPTDLQGRVASASVAVLLVVVATVDGAVVALGCRGRRVDVDLGGRVPAAVSAGLRLFAVHFECGGVAAFSEDGELRSGGGYFDSESDAVSVQCGRFSVMALRGDGSLAWCEMPEEEGAEPSLSVAPGPIDAFAFCGSVLVCAEPDKLYVRRVSELCLLYLWKQVKELPTLSEFGVMSVR